MKAFAYTTLAVLLAVSSTQADWLQFRGPNGSGYIGDEKLPESLDEEKSVAWKLKLPGKGLSSPIVVGDRVFITASSGSKQERLHVFCYNAKDGSIIWERQFFSTGRTMCHSKCSVAAPSPVSDGTHVLAFYSSNDLFCLDLEGNVKWLRGLTNDYPNASNSLGMSSSPIIADGTAIVQVENDSDSFSVGVDLKTGKNLWKKARTKQANWTSPLVLKGAEGKELAALQSSKGVDVVQPKTGEVVWRYGEGASTIPSSAVGEDGVLYIPSNGLTAVKRSAEAKSEVIWQSGSMRPGTASPLAHREHIYVINNSGVLNCVDTKDGKRLWRLRLKGAYGGSPIANDTHLLAFNEEGLVQVVKLGDETGEIVSTLELGEMVQCTPAVSDGALFVRSNRHLWKLVGS
jgi:outer membrane protein assembly factor BamB